MRKPPKSRSEAFHAFTDGGFSFTVSIVAKSKTIQVSKLDAARRNLRTAIRLWFTDGDPVAIHTLASTAHEIVHTLFRRCGLKGLLFDSRMVKDEYRSKWAAHITKPYTFFKHARHDPDGVIDFNPDVNEGLMMACVHGLSRMEEDVDLEEWAFGQWMKIQHPEYFYGDDGKPLSPDEFKEHRDIPRRVFFDNFEAGWLRRKNKRTYRIPIS
jgi:hypothetical protein